MLQRTFKMIVLPVLLATGVISQAGGESVPPYTEKEFLRYFPEAKKDGICYLFRLGGCDVVAVAGTYGERNVNMLFVHGEEQSEAEKIAEELKTNLFTTAQIRPFEDEESWVAIILPQDGHVLNTASHIIGRIISKEDPKFPVQFIAWQGKQLRVRVDHSYSSSYFSTSYSSGRKSNGIIELLLDVTLPRLQCSELRIIKGTLTSGEIARFIAQTTGGVYSPTQSMPKKELAALRKSFSNTDIVSYNPNSDFCIVSSKKSYRFGEINAVRESLRRKQSPELASFKFPHQQSMMPDKRKEMLAAEQMPVRNQETQETNHAGDPSGQNLPPPRNFQEAAARYTFMLDKL